MQLGLLYLGTAYPRYSEFHFFKMHIQVISIAKLDPLTDVANVWLTFPDVISTCLDINLILILDCDKYILFLVFQYPLNTFTMYGLFYKLMHPFPSK